jgi:hypothetical protein
MALLGLAPGMIALLLYPGPRKLWETRHVVADMARWLWWHPRIGAAISALAALAVVSWK